MKKYYGIKDASAPVASQVVEEKSDPFNLDGNTFNTSKYFASLLKQKPLQGLIEKDNELVGEIREIDGEMKTLVYENYNKFISATDTIRKMKSNVEDMESEMGRLNKNIAEISRQSKFINEELGPNRKKIQQLSNVHNSLKRLQFIFELPNRLQQCLTKKKYSQAVKYYYKASRLLSHYQDMAAFKGIERDCDQIMDKVKLEIWKVLTDVNVSSQEIAKNTKLLVMLGEDSRKLWKQYIKIQISMLQKIQDDNPNPNSVETLIQVYVTPLEEVVKHFKQLFLVDASKEQDSASPIAKLNEKEMNEARDDLLNAIKPFLDKFFTIASDLIKLPDDLSMETQLLQQKESLEKLNGALTVNSIQSLASVTDVHKKINELTADWENNLIKALFDSSLKGLGEHIKKFAVSLEDTSNKEDPFELDTDGIAGFIQDTQTWLINRLSNSCFPLLKNCLDISNKETIVRAQTGLKIAFERIANVFETIHKINELDQASLQILMLVGSRLCYDLADNGIFQTYSTFSSTFFKRQSLPKNEYRSPDFETRIEPRIVPDMNVIIECYLKTGQTLLNMQMMQDGYRLSTNIQEAYLYSPSAAVSQVSEIWFLVFNRIKYIEKLVESVYPQQQNTPHRSSVDNSESEYDYEPYSTRNNLQSTHSLATVSSMSEAAATKFGSNDFTSNMMNNIDKLFAERVDVYRKVEPTPSGVSTSLILILLKSFMEVTREVQIDTNRFQQIQVDIEYIKRIFWPYAGEEKWYTTMLQEVLSAVHSRCASPKPLSQDELALILTL